MGQNKSVRVIEELFMKINNIKEKYIIDSN